MPEREQDGRRTCHWCGEAIESEPVLWDIQEKDNRSAYWRYRFCSDDCLDAAKHTDQRAAETHTDGERLQEENMSEVHK